MTKTKFEIIDGNTINGYALNPGRYTPKALQNEINRVLEEQHSPIRYIWDSKLKSFRLMPRPTFKLRTPLTANPRQK